MVHIHVKSLVKRRIQRSCSVPLTMQPAGRAGANRVIYADVKPRERYSFFLFPQPLQQRLKVHGFHDRIFMCCAKE
jgi:hypothetical protein